MKQEFDIFEIEYTESDLEYIDDLIKYLDSNIKNIMNYFGLTTLERKISIKLWNSKEEYRKVIGDLIKNYERNNTVPEWEVARSTNNKKVSRIDLISYKESLKCKGHSKDTLDNLFKVIVHEFVHTCQFEYNHHTESLTWFSEALATNLSHQYEEYPLTIEVPLERIINGQVSYINYHTMGKYLLDNYPKEYILELAKNKKLLLKDTKKIYEETLEYIKGNRIKEYNQVSTPEELLSFMDKYIKYGLVDDNNKVYEWDMDSFQDACQNEWKLKSGIDIVESGYGHCWDQVEIERDWFAKHNYDFKTLFIYFESDIAPYVCHTYLVYKDKKKDTWNWFEHADENNKGIHEYNTLEEAILAQRDVHIKFNQSANLPMNDEIINTIHIYEYQPPKLESSNQEFLDNIFNNSIDITPQSTTKRTK